MKRAIYLSVLVVITVGCILWRVGSDAFGWFYSGDETEQGTEVSLEGTQVLDAFSEIRVESDVMDVTIQKGTDYSLSYRTAGKNKPAYSVKDGVLSVTQKQQKKHWNLGMVSNKSAAMTITVPEDVDYETALPDVFRAHHVTATLEKVRTESMGTLFELTYQVNLPSAVPSKALLDDLRERNGNLPILFTNPGDKDSL